MATCLGLSRGDPLNSEMISAARAPLQGLPGRISQCEVNETARIWTTVESAPHEQLGVAEQLFVMGNDNGRLSSEPGE
jgi:hypothetical protein